MGGWACHFPRSFTGIDGVDLVIYTVNDRINVQGFMGFKRIYCTCTIYRDACNLFIYTSLLVVLCLVI